MQLETGLKTGSWELLDKNENRKGHWWVRCSCGNERSVRADALRYEKSLSCGHAVANHKTHGMTGTPEYKAWLDMWARVRRDLEYIRKGITVCSRWEKFENFYADMGEKPKGDFSLGRVDNDESYSPFNCRWETSPMQNANKGDTVLITSKRFGTRSRQEWVGHLIAHTRDTSWTTRRLKMFLDNGMTLDELLNGKEITSLNAECAAHYGSDFAAA
ncbi:MAG TPA: hypothetical protein VK578_09200 [Edaphobacter sp.]|nr:hypothetical protein [Edaphobacter sp.]